MTTEPMMMLKLDRDAEEDVWGKLEMELERIKRLMNMGYEVKVIWLPGEVRYHRGRRLKEWVEGNIIYIYVEDPQEALELVRHGFAHWLLNRSNKYRRQLANKLIEFIEDRMYEEDERIVEVLAKLLKE